jgi:AcrR family transcriptional regulator
MSRTERTNLTAAERREAVIDAAITEFAEKGLHGTSTEDIARRVGISQPYIFRLFGTKKDLFIAASSRVYERVEVAFREAADRVPGGGLPVLHAMGEAYKGLLNNREDLLMLLQTFAACDDPDVQRVTRGCFERLFMYVQKRAGIGEDVTSAFFAQGMLLNVAIALDLPMLLGCPDWETFKRHIGDRDEHLALMKEHLALAGQLAAPRPGRNSAEPPAEQRP